MAQAKEGDVVRVNYTGKLEDGTVFDTSENREPLDFTIGEEKVIPGFEQAVVGMEPGETKTETLPPERAYGSRREDMVMQMNRDEIPENVDPAVGQELQLRMQNGQTVPVRIADLSDEAVTIDANHPLAGRTLVFDIELLDVQENKTEGESQIVTP